MTQHTQSSTRDARNDQLHVPVMRDRCLDLLEPALDRPDAVFVDCTLGFGGHAEAALRRFPSLTVIGLDRDREALEAASDRLRPFGERFVPIHTVFDGIGEALASRGVSAVDGILFDLGVSSVQLDDPDRGFSYAKEAPLDMRMNQSEGRTAAEILASASERELADLFRAFGDEPLAGRYARAIAQYRETQKLVTSTQLVDVLQDATPAAVKHQRHPAKRVFQALRVAVNDELGAIDRAVPQALNLLKVGGRIVVMSYQSHEDRRIKKLLSAASTSRAPQGLPIEPEALSAPFQILTRGAERASATEQEDNPRSIPARLRAAERMREAHV